MPGASRSRLARPRRIDVFPFALALLDMAPTLGQLVRPIIQNWAAGTELPARPFRGGQRAAGSCGGETALSPGRRSIAKPDRQRRVRGRQPLADRTRARGAAEGLATDRARG